MLIIKQLINRKINFRRILHFAKNKIYTFDKL